MRQILERLAVTFADLFLGLLEFVVAVEADQVVFPENESGVRLARNLLSSGFLDIIELSQDLSVVSLDVRPEWVGKSLIELNLRRKYSINVVAVIKDDKISTSVDPEKKLDQNMKLIVIANIARLNRLR